MESFAKYYEMPLHVDEYCPFYIWTKDNEMAFNYLDEEKINNGDLNEITEIVNAINGYSPGYFNAKISDVEQGIISIENKDVLIVRGWGHLTSLGGHGLSIDEAINVQNDFIKWTVKQLTRNVT